MTEQVSSLLHVCDDRSPDLLFAFNVLWQIRAEKISAFPFLKQSMDYALLLYIGNEQVRGRPTNMNNILTSGIGTPSTVIRRLTELEAQGVVRKVKSGSDRRNTYYELTELPLKRVQSFLARIVELFDHRETRLHSYENAPTISAIGS